MPPSSDSNQGTPETAGGTVLPEANLQNSPVSSELSASLPVPDSESVVLTPPTVTVSENKQPDKKPGHGRNGSDDYTGAQTISVKNAFHTGDLCPSGCGGRLHLLSPGVVIRVTGSPLLISKRYELEKLRCALCGDLLTSKLPEGVSEEKYDNTAKAVLAIGHYHLGMPFYRTEKFQDAMGVPLPDATQWELVEEVADGTYPVFHALEHLAAQGELSHNDDTPVKILSLMRENKTSEVERRGMQTTGIVSHVEERQIYLYYSGRQHAGENLKDILEKRLETLPPMIQMCDALSRNVPKELKTILCNCLSHGRRNFYELYDDFPEECTKVVEWLGLVYRYDAEAKEQRLLPQARLEYHRLNSGPVMEALKQWSEEQLTQKKVEPNSSLGYAIRYLLKHWQKLTQFLQISGAPLDNNIVERALKVPIRLRKASLFYKTVHSAFVGSLLMSLIETCVRAKQNPVKYLVALLENKSAVFKFPQQWLPWNYQNNFTVILQAAA